MKYVALVSHGTFAYGMESVLKMLAGGEREDVISSCLEDGMSAEQFADDFGQKTAHLTPGDEVVLLADLMGGSPLTNAVNVLTEKGLAKNTIALGGMNLAMALTAVMMKDGMPADALKETLISEAKEAIKEFPLQFEEEEASDDEI